MSTWTHVANLAELPDGILDVMVENGNKRYNGMLYLLNKEVTEV